jgi:hypothetical protein
VTEINQHTAAKTGTQRKYLGGCAFGRMFLRPNPKTSGIDLLWTGSNLSPGLDDTMNDTIRAAWHDFGMALGRKLPSAPHPVAVKGHPDIYWLCRLPPKWFEIEPRRGLGYGASLFEVGETPPRPKMVRLAPIPARRSL